MKNFGFVLITLTIIPLMGFTDATDSHFESKISSSAIAYKTMDEAAVEALRLSTQKSKQIEYGGCIFENNNYFFYTDPVEGERENFKATCIVQGKFCAIYHTHPMHSIEGISGYDIAISSNLNKTSYVGLIDQNRVVKFVPGKTRTACLNSRICGPNERISLGDEVDILLAH